MKPIIKCENLHKKGILKNIFLEIYNNEKVALIGESKAGKTYLLKSLVGINKVDKGQVCLNSFDININFVDAITLVGVVFNYEDLYLHLNGFKNMKIAGNLYRVNDNKLLELLKLFSLEKIMLNKVYDYSISEKKRLILARALVADPNILIIDNIFSDIDDFSKKLLINILDNLENISFIISDYDIEILNKICNKFIILKKGEIIKTGKITSKQSLKKIYEKSCN